MPEPSIDPDRLVRIGVIGRPHGVRGALKIHLDNPRGRTLVAGRQVQLKLPDRALAHVVASAGGGVVGFVGVVDRTAAEGLVHAEVLVRRADLVGEGDGAFLVDLIGQPVVDTHGAALGTLAGFSDTGSQLLAEVRGTTGAGVTLVPFVAPILVDAGPPVVLAPPPGLFDETEALVAEDADAPAGVAKKE